MADWSQDLDSTIFTMVKINFPKTLKDKYPNIRFTSADIVGTPASFPTVKIKVTGMVERGQDLANTTINAVDTTVQVDVLTNTSQSDADRIIGEILSIFKAMRFNITAMPIASQEGDVFRSIMRCNRIIGNGDIL